MQKKIYAIYGASGFGREIIPLARIQLMQTGVQPEQLFFVDDGINKNSVNGHQVLNYGEYLKVPASERYVALAIANSKIREKLALQCKKDGLKFWDIHATNVVIMDDVNIAEGAILSPFVTLTSNIHIGQQFHANIYSYVAHDCIIGDFVTFAPSVKCNGNVTIENHAYIGTGAIIRQGQPNNPLIIGTGAIVGMGAVVTKSVPAGVTVVGNPARILNRQ